MANLKKLTPDERRTLRIQLATDGLRAIGQEPWHFGAQAIPKEAVGLLGVTEQAWQSMCDMFCLAVADEEEITTETVQHARQVLQDRLRAAREVLQEIEG